jgi:cbb3-type cytochrome oxidase maturation protein
MSLLKNYQIKKRSMSIIIILISVSLVIAVSFLFIFIWNLKSGQYDDTYSPSVRMLFDDKLKNKETTGKNGKSTITGNASEKI